MTGRVLLPDPTGTNPRYLVANQTLWLYRVGQVVTFPRGGVFLNSLKVIDPANPNAPLVQGSDWKIDTTCYDDTAASDARIADPTFSTDLISKIIITTGRTLPLMVVVSYQSFYNVADWSVPGVGDPLNVTPATIGDLLQLTSRLVQQQSTVTTQTGITTADITLYPEDLNEEISTNLIRGETHTVNTATGVSLIRPKNGPFFRDSVVLTVNGLELTPDVDYQVDTFDKNRTRKSRNTSGIYWAIMLLTAQAGEVSIDYHTVGGQVTQEDYLLMAAQIKDVTSFLNNLDIVTADTLSLAPIMQSIFWRLDNQDKQMRRLTSTPNPASATAGVSVQKVFTATDSNLHWYDVASLYTVIKDGPVFTADRFKGRLFLPTAGVAWTFTVEANLVQGKLPFTFSTESLLVDPGVAEDGSTNTATPVWPILRAVWNSVESGIVLQVGLALPNLTDTPVIEDLSTAESGWLLNQQNPVISGQPTPAAMTVHDSGFVLPDGSSVWIGDNTSKAAYYIPPATGGYPIFAGKSDYFQNFQQNELNGTSLYPMGAYPISVFKSLTLDYGTDDGVTGRISVPLSPQRGGSALTTLIGSGVIVYGDNQMIPLTITISQDSGGLTYSVNVSGDSIPAASTLTIRGLRLNA